MARVSRAIVIFKERRNDTMELLKQRIRQDGVVKGTDVLKVDSFLNQSAGSSSAGSPTAA